MDLVRLHLQNNDFYGSIPHRGYWRMEELLLHNNQLDGEIWGDWFGNAQYLRKLSLFGNNLYGTSETVFCHLFETGKLEVVQVDQEAIDCECCTDNRSGSADCRSGR